MTEKELAVRLVRHGIATQRRTPNEHAEANQDAEVKASGNAATANALEFLGKHSVVADVQPTFGSAGIGFAYTIAPQFVQELTTDDAIDSRIEVLFSDPKTETGDTIHALSSGCERQAGWPEVLITCDTPLSLSAGPQATERMCRICRVA